MGQGSQWHQYLAAAQQAALVLGLLLTTLALIFSVTGRCFTTNQGIVAGKKYPKVYWRHLAAYYTLGLFLLGLYVFTAF